MKEYIKIIKGSTNIQAILFFGLLIQVIFCYVSVGYFHPDQHFQILEFSSLQLHQTNAANSVWELEQFIRPTLQVYIFSSFRLFCETININNPFSQLTILRFIQGLGFFFFLNYVSFFYTKHQEKKVLIITLILINFSWFLPYSRTLFSSEVTASLLFFGAIFFLHKNILENKTTALKNIIYGIIVALSFYLRFQLGFAIIGLFIWIVLFEKKHKLFFLISIGFLIGVAFNTYIDYHFYNKFVCSPYLYFKVNILQGVASSFGEKSFLYYLGVLSGVVFVAPISVVLIFHYLKISIQKFKHPIVITTLFFLVGHCLVAHKEERFLFTIINIIPIVLGFGGFNFLFKKALKPLIIFSIVLNCILLIAFIFIPYSQSIHFLQKLSTNKSLSNRIYCIERIPLETESKLPLTFYSAQFKHIQFEHITQIVSVTLETHKPQYLISTFNDLRDYHLYPEEMGYTAVTYSSQFLWTINKFLASKNLNSINDIWVLYKLKQ